MIDDLNKHYDEFKEVFNILPIVIQDKSEYFLSIPIDKWL